jgi:hypothetical protein
MASRTGPVAEPPTLLVMHVLPQRVRLQWPADCDPAAIDHLCSQLACQSWLSGWQRREGARSLVLQLQPGCPAVRWQLALAALGWTLQGREPAPAAASQPSPWERLSRQIGGSMVGAASGQLLLGGAGAALGGTLAGPGGAWVLGGSGAVLGAVIGSIVGSAVAEGQASQVPQTLGQLTWRRLGTRVGEEVGSSTGLALGAALAGPLGAAAGLAAGSVLGGQLASDLTGPAARRQAIGHGGWIMGMLRDSSAEGLSERLASRLGAGLTGGSEVGRQLGASLGQRFSRKIDWNASLQRHQLVPGSAAAQAGGPQLPG